ncbi:CDP-diacylglycerol--inositol 3-phosphatidyltransferase 1-like [Camellia sinensis]|uniref:CDP-diacylglycerol--inositol 3-phosphatidyltransferase 1-like n=1 Tax=Camellia sinensis TaxID=4442 RepID=UPI001035CABF|nr:CDP-diacylglycerol--inositol 3-phosphatidyltransferase 1-like [Camellia sinensis]
MLKRKNKRPQNSLQQSCQELNLPVSEARLWVTGHSFSLSSLSFYAYIYVFLIGGREIYSMAKNSRPRKLSVYLYIPNIIGYIRVLMNCFAFYICFSDKKLFSVLYFVSFVCDALDGWFARKFNQVSTFGAVLVFYSDNNGQKRISTTCLLVILSQIYRPGLVFLSLLALDIASHWLQMYSTFLVGKVSHKDVKDSTNWLFKAYYGNRIFMCYCCVACEVLYIILFLLAKNQNENLKNVIMDATKQNSVLSVLLVLLVVGWAIKQAVNVIQIKTAADACVDYDINKKQKP